jgi:hypothetical protein
MKPWGRWSAVTACFALALACEQQTEVQRQTLDLQEAQKNVAKTTQELESQLAKAQADVARLEQKLALARQGLTDDVLENQKELTEALQAQEHKVEAELGQAKREAQIHTRDSEAALKQLGQTAPPAAATTPAVDPAQAGPAPVDNPDRSELVPVKGGPDPRPEGTVDIQPGTPAPPAAVPPNDPPAPVPAPPAATTIPPSDTPPSQAPPGNASPPAPAAPAPR